MAGTLVLTGNNFTGTNGLGVTQGNDAKSYLNWDKFVWQVKDGSVVTSSVKFNPETEVTSAIVTNSTTMTITLDAAANTALKGTENFAAQGAADSVAISVGFIKDISGNVSTTDAATLAPAYTDTGRPTVTSFTTTTPTGSYGVGAEIVITATTSEVIGKGGTITATFGFGGTATLTADAAGTSLTGTYTVPSGVSTTALNISSFTTTAADLYGNTLQTTVPTGSVFNGKTIAIDTSAPTTTITAVEYTDSVDGTGTLVLTGDNFTGTNGLGVTQGSDASTYLNWGNLAWNVTGATGTPTSVTFNPELTSAAPPERLFGELFRLMSQSGQTKLLAWRALEEGAENTLLDAGPSDKLIQQIVEGVARRLQGQDVELARNLIFLALSAAVGWGICGPTLRRSLGMSDAQQDRFPAWVGEQLPKLIQD